MRINPSTYRSFNRLAAFSVALLAAFWASQAQAAVVVALDLSADYSLSAPTAGPASQPVPNNDDDAASRRELLKALLASSPTDGGMTSTSTTLASGGASSLAIAVSIHDLPQPVLIAWLSLGQYLALPSLPPSGLFRPPRAS